MLLRMRSNPALSTTKSLLQRFHSILDCLNFFHYIEHKLIKNLMTLSPDVEILLNQPLYPYFSFLVVGHGRGHSRVCTFLGSLAIGALGKTGKCIRACNRSSLHPVISLINGRRHSGVLL